jgi:lipoate synthase
LRVLRFAKENAPSKIVTKSALMLGLGETIPEIKET